ncbi:hypothetical protein, partial [Massilia mucilaginosa]|uniref:hypothetical protein n=1 Tax=Massilia mucilaginosa TaxID=2609282 RepID=UPI001CB75129
PIPNRTVKRFYADDSAATSVKVGHRQASYKKKTPVSLSALKIALSANRGFFSSAFLSAAPLKAFIVAARIGKCIRAATAGYCGLYVTFKV